MNCSDMKNRIYNDKLFARFVICIFSFIAGVTLVASFFKPQFLILFGLSIIMILTGFAELKKLK